MTRYFLTRVLALAFAMTLGAHVGARLREYSRNRVGVTEVEHYR